MWRSPLDQGKTLTGDILVTTPLAFGPNQVLDDELQIRLRGPSDIELRGLIRVHMFQDITGEWVFNLAFEWQTPANRTMTRTSRPALDALLTGCEVPRDPMPVVVAAGAASGPMSITWPTSFLGRIGLPGAPWPRIGNDHQQIQLVIDQKVLVAGQSTQINVNFENGPLPVSGLQFDTLITDTTAPSTPVTGFVIDPEVPTDLPNLGPGAAREHRWLIVPTAQLGVTSASGKAFLVSGVIRYTVGGVPYEHITPALTILVYPKPNLRITYRLPHPTDVATSFELRADIQNLGPGDARDLRIMVQQPVVVGNASGIPIGFAIADTTLEGSSLGPVFNPHIGNLAPGQTKTIVWRIGSSVPGRFTQFHVDLRGATWNGKLLPATIQEVNTVYNDPDPGGSEQLPIIFVPGIGGTQLFQDIPNGVDPELWIPLNQVMLDVGDRFMDPLLLAVNGSDPMVTGSVIYPFQVLRDAVGGEGTAGYFNLDIYNSFVTYLTASNTVSRDIADDYPELDPYVLGTVGQDANDSSSWYNHVVDYQPRQNLWLFPVDFRMHLPTQADRLDVLVNDVLEATGADQVQLVGHSQGGLIIRNYISDPSRAAKVEQVVTLGTPYLGSPNAFAGLRYGLAFLDYILPFGVSIVTNPTKMKELLQNWPGGLELLPANQAYFDVLAARNPRTSNPQALGYFSTSRDLNRDGQPEGALIDWSTMGDLLTAASIVDYMRTYTESDQTFGYSVRAYNAGLINQAAAFQAEGIQSWQSSTVPRTQIVGAGLCTTGSFREWAFWQDRHTHIVKVGVTPTIGDGTVPIWSASMGEAMGAADVTGGANVLYAWQSEHQTLPNNLAPYVVALLNDRQVDFVDRPTAPHQLLQARPPSKMRCDVTEIHSPANLYITDAAGQTTGLIGQGPDYRVDVPNSTFYPFEENQVAMTSADEPYTVTVRGTGTGTFDLIWRRWEDEDVLTGLVFKEVPVTPQTVASFVVTPNGPAPSLSVDINGDGQVDQTVAATTTLNEVTGNDFTPPATSISLSGTIGEGNWYRGPVTVTLAANDAQGSGVLRTQYVVGEADTLITYANPIVIASEGTTSIQALSTDWAGNPESEPVTATVRIDLGVPRTTISVAGARAADGWYTNGVTVTLQAVDPILSSGDAGSGVARTESSLDGGLSWLPYSEPFRIQSGGAVRLQVRSIDVAGNVETAVTQTLLVVPTAAVRPVLECVAVASGGGYVARFGYSNENTVPITIPVGSRNRFSPNPQNRGQTTTFQPGRHVAVFEVPFISGNQVWTLLGRTSTASPGSARCP